MALNNGIEQSHLVIVRSLGMHIDFAMRVVRISFIKVRGQVKVKIENDLNIVMLHIVKKGLKNGARLAC